MGIELVDAFEGHSGQVSSLVFSPEDALIVSGGSDEAIKYWEFHYKKSKKLVGPSGPSSSGIGISLFSTTYTVEHTLYQSLKAPKGDDYYLSYAREKGLVILLKNSKGLEIQEAGTGKVIKTGPTDAAIVTSLALSWDGNLLAAGMEDGTIRIKICSVR